MILSNCSCIKIARNVRQDDSLPILQRLILLGYTHAIWHLHEELHKVYDICDAYDGEEIDLKEIVKDLKHNAPIFEFTHVNCLCYLWCFSKTNPDLEWVVVDWRGSSEIGRIEDNKDRKERRRKEFYNLFNEYRELYNELYTNKYLTGRSSDPVSGIYSFDVTVYADEYNVNITNQLKDSILEVVLNNSQKYLQNVEDARLVGDEYIIQLQYPLTIYYWSKEELMDIAWKFDERRPALMEVITELENLKDFLIFTQDRINEILINFESLS